MPPAGGEAALGEVSLRHHKLFQLLAAHVTDGILHLSDSSAEASERLNQLREALKAEDAEMDALGCEAQQTDEEERKKFPLLCAKKEALYRITRTVWEKVGEGRGGEGRGEGRWRKNVSA